MDEMNLGGTPAEPNDEVADFEPAWTTFTQRLANYVAGMQYGEDVYDALVVQIPTGTDPEGCAPYAQFKSHTAPGRVRAEIAGDWYLAIAYACNDDAQMMALGWTWEEQGNWWIEGSTDEAAQLARVTVAALRECFDIAHPQLMTFHTLGPSGERAAYLGLTPTANLAIEPSADEVDVVRPTDRDHLVKLVGEALRDPDGALPDTDVDGDYVLDGQGQPIWVSVNPESPAIRILAISTTEIRSRTKAAVETSILNRDSLYVRWHVHERTVWQTLTFPAQPFAEQHLTDMIEQFRAALLATRGDLRLRCDGKGL